MSTANVFIMILQQWRRDTREAEFIDVSQLLQDSNKGFSWTCVQTAGEEAARLIKASQSVNTVSRI
jgi:hypothetical protein